MEVSDGSQQALQIAFQTLKERCKHFQQHIAVLEAENVRLRVQQVNQDDTDSLSETDLQKRRVRELVEQNEQLQTHLKIVTDENQELWTKLSKLSEVNKSMGTHLTRIKDTLSQHSSKQPVIRSKTFTMEDSPRKLHQKNLIDENGKVSLELEDVSLKLINSIAKEKRELELQCSQMMEIQNSNFVIGNVVTVENNELADTAVDEYLANFNSIKYVLLEEKNKLTRILHNLEKLPKQGNYIRKTNFCNDLNIFHFLGTKSDVAVQTVKESFAESRSDTVQPVAPQQERNPQPDLSDVEKICPVCSLAFTNDITFIEFQNHVVEHFVADDHPEYEVL